MNFQVDIKITGGDITGKILPSLNYNNTINNRWHLSQKLINVFNDNYWVDFLIFLTCDVNPDDRSIIILPKFTVLVKFKLLKIEFQ